jgi:hypothetical protein
MTKSTKIYVSVITVLAIAAVFLIGLGTGLGATPKPNTLQSCTNEDSTNCIWDARIHGNGEGRSFIDYGGHTYYLEGK